MSISKRIAGMRRGTHKSDAFDMVTLEAAHCVIAPVVEAALNGRGFEAVAPLKRVRFDGGGWANEHPLNGRCWKRPASASGVDRSST
jgi:hypothetical protein